MIPVQHRTDRDPKSNNSQKVPVNVDQHPINSQKVLCNASQHPDNSQKVLTNAIQHPDNSQMVLCNVDQHPDNSQMVLCTVDQHPGNSQKVLTNLVPHPDNSQMVLCNVVPHQDNSQKVLSNVIPQPDNSQKVLSDVTPQPDNSQKVLSLLQQAIARTITATGSFVSMCKLLDPTLFALVVLTWGCKPTPMNCDVYRTGTFQEEIEPGIFTTYERTTGRQVERTPHYGIVSESNIRWIGPCTYQIFDRVIREGETPRPNRPTDTITVQITQLDSAHFDYVATASFSAAELYGRQTIVPTGR